MNLRTSLAALTLLLVLSACGQSTSNPITPPTSSGKQHLGLVEADGGVALKLEQIALLGFGLDGGDGSLGIHHPRQSAKVMRVGKRTGLIEGEQVVNRLLVQTIKAFC